MQLTGLGLYTIPEAARLANVRAAALRRWAYGYESRTGATVQHHAPIWESEISTADVDGISFHDLLEARFVKAFRDLGISLQAIRIAAINAREMLESRYPFACRKFRTDGKTIFAEAMNASGELDLLDLRQRQYVFTKVVEQSLYAGIEFDANERALRWFPLERNKSVVLDPDFAFGKPTITGTSLRTDVLYDAWLAESKDKQRVARLYEVPIKSVEAAVRFEQQRAA